VWIVRLALAQPHTFIVMAICIFLFGIISIRAMPVDIFPQINIPIVSCAWTYTGMSPAQIEKMITTPTERALTSTVNGIQRMESVSLTGMSIIKLFLHQDTNLGEAVGQVTSTSNAVIKTLPPGITPPFVTQSSATDVPVLQLIVASPKLGEAELFDLANQFIRVQLAVVQGTTIPFPNGGKFRIVSVDLQPSALYGHGISAEDVITAVNTSSIIAPSGTAKMGRTEYIVALNNMPQVIDKLNSIPLKHVGDATVYLRDVAFVHDGAQPQINIVNLDGHRSVIMSILKRGENSTMAVVNAIKAQLPNVRATLPEGVTLKVLTDQSKFVQECVDEVFHETVNAAVLTAIFMLAILGSWRSTLIVITSIPLAILCSICGLHMTGNTINSMTLGGIALAVGMLVDDATVEIENVHRQLDMGKHIEQAILDGAQEVALPAMVSTISICIVFLPVFLLTEPSKSLFVPLGLAVSFAMIASYGLSRTIVPLMSKHLFAAEEHAAAKAAEGHEAKKPGFFLSIHLFIDRHFNGLRDGYHQILEKALHHRAATVAMFLGLYLVSFCLMPFIGTDFFPPIDAGQLRLHLTTIAGTRIEETERNFRAVENSIKKIIPAEDIEILTDNIGMPVSPVNYAFSDCQTISAADGEILITLSEHRKRSTADYQKEIRAMLTRDYPQFEYYFQPADIVTQILNAGLPAPIDVKVMNFTPSKVYDIAVDLKRKIAKVKGAVDVCLHQRVNAPQYMFNVDRTRADQMGLTQKDISNSLLVNVGSSFQVAPNFWVNPGTGVQYNLAAQTPQYLISSVNDLANITVDSTKTQRNEKQPTQLLSNVAKPERQFTDVVVNHTNIQPTYDIYAATQNRDLGGVSRDIEKIVEEARKSAPAGSVITVAGQVMSMKGAMAGLLVGLVGAVALVYLLLVVNFQSWLDPIIILMAIPGALAGICWAMFVTGTTFSVPALMGAIMTIGVASANSILMVTFCNEQMHAGMSALEAASQAGFQRFRPVCMTAMAMILGMIPMALSTGQNAPIGRAVIGGLSVATFSTLFFVPLIFSIVRHERKKQQAATMAEQDDNLGNQDNIKPGE
jgi:multidrug efflux pump subunit AcrB